MLAFGEAHSKSFVQVGPDDPFGFRAGERVGLVGTSLGSCYAFLASVHDPRIEVNVFNHCSTYFADVVWEGLSSQHIRQSLESAVTLEQLRESWMVISPPNYIERYAGMKKKSTKLNRIFVTWTLMILSTTRSMQRLPSDPQS